MCSLYLLNLVSLKSEVRSNGCTFFKAGIVRFVIAGVYSKEMFLVNFPTSKILELK